ncbi:hypothetical protein CVT25_001974 [Psilocybe cyanescens]|uniref:Uncharacterized protein n=1 Tax=Psilocybe cyanescens TaxID=93625 RepID=A0A409WQT8_PSICY|nr:hypothetical protein CVT25_001974 [Psilocybe cyanescens]
MLHTIHLAAIKLLEAIGAFSKTEARKAASRSGNYQDSTTAPLSRVHDDDAAVQEDGDQQDFVSLSLDTSSNILPAVKKLPKIIQAIQSSPQRKQAWFKQLEDSF